MKNIILIGFMGTGKTSAGRLLASRLGYSFVDTDQRVEKECAMSIKEIFANRGESYFREKEAEVVRKVSRQKRMVISTGGGTIVNPENMKALRENGIVISLTADVDVILERTGRKNTRPLLARLDMDERRKTIIKLRAQREELYRQADFSIDTGNLTPLQVVDRIIAFTRKEMRPHA